MKEREALKLSRELIERILKFKTVSVDDAKKTLDLINEQLSAQPEQELTSIERHERNVQQFLGTPKPKEPEHEPVAEVISSDKHALGEQTIAVDVPLEIGTLLYTTPPQRKPWVSLTYEDVTSSHPYSVTRDKGCFHAGVEWADAKLKEKNTK